MGLPQSLETRILMSVQLFPSSNLSKWPVSADL